MNNSEIEIYRNEVDSLDLSLLHSDALQLITNWLNTFNLLVFGAEKIIPELTRLTINKYLSNNNNETITNIALLKNPPKEAVKKFGRANLINQSILYATSILPTALQELNPQTGDVVTISEWELIKPNEALMVYPVIDFYNCKDFQLKTEFSRALQRYPEKEQRGIIEMNQVLAVYFGRYVERGKHQNYFYSAFFANKILYEYYEGQIEAIIYPSVRDSAHYPNIAIKPEIFDQKYKIKKISECTVYANEGGMMCLKENKSSIETDDYGRIIWRLNYQEREIHIAI